jgi:hypothetical protein
VELDFSAGLTTDDKIIWRMRISCWILKSVNTHSEYVVLIDFLLQQWLHETASMLPYTYEVYFLSRLEMKRILQKLVGHQVWAIQMHYIDLNLMLLL